MLGIFHEVRDGRIPSPKFGPALRILKSQSFASLAQLRVRAHLYTLSLAHTRAHQKRTGALHNGSAQQLLFKNQKAYTYVVDSL